MPKMIYSEKPNEIPSPEIIDNQDALDTKESIKFSPAVGQINHFIKAWSLFDESTLTQKGEEVARILKGKRIIDLGCGMERNTLALQRFAKTCGATEYIGVDIENPLRFSESQEPVLPTKWVTKDILEHVSSLEPADDAVYILSGIDAQPSELSEAYFKKLAKELERVSMPGSAIIIGPYTHEMKLDLKFETVQKYRDSYTSSESKILIPRK